MSVCSRPFYPDRCIAVERIEASFWRPFFGSFLWADKEMIIIYLICNKSDDNSYNSCNLKGVKLTIGLTIRIINQPTEDPFACYQGLLFLQELLRYHQGGKHYRVIFR